MKQSRFNSMLCAISAELGAAPEFSTEMTRNHGKGPNFGEKKREMLKRCVVRCSLSTSVFGFTVDPYSQTCYLRMWKLWQLCLVSTPCQPVKFQRCLWDELISSRYAFNDDDKKVLQGRLGSFYCGDLCNLSS